MIAFQRRREDTAASEPRPVIAPGSDAPDPWTYSAPEDGEAPAPAPTHPPIPAYHRLG